MAHVIFSNNSVTLYKSERTDSRGKSRIVVHFLSLLKDGEYKEMTIPEKYSHAIKKAKRFGWFRWRKYHCKEFGGGLITSADYNEQMDVLRDVERIREQNL